MIASRILVQAEADPAGVVTAARQEVPSIWEAASVGARCDVIAQKGVRDTGQLAGDLPSADTGKPTMSCPVVHQ